MDKEIQTETITLILLGGDTIEISYQDNVDEFDEVYQEMINAIEKGEYWNVGNWCNFTARYKDIPIQNINCKLVVGNR